jgi:hypothetical protein
VDVSKECLWCIEANNKENWDNSQSCPTRVIRVCHTGVGHHSKEWLNKRKKQLFWDTCVSHTCHTNIILVSDTHAPNPHAS